MKRRMLTKDEIDELQPAGRQARGSDRSIEAVRPPSYNPFKIFKIFRFVSRAGRDTAEGEALSRVAVVLFPVNSFRSA
jgi:hypothetical protein